MQPALLFGTQLRTLYYYSYYCCMNSMSYATVTAFLLALSPTAWAQMPQETSSSQAPASAPVRPFQVAYLRLGLGTSHEISYNYRCARFFVEYSPLLTRRLGLAGRLVGIAGKPTSDFEKQLPKQNYKAAYVEEEVLFYPFGADKRVRFAVGAGGFAGYYKRNGFDYINVVSGKVTDYKLASEQGVHAGYLGSLSVEAGLGAQQRWQVGLKSTIQNGIGGITTMRTHSLTLGRRL